MSDWNYLHNLVQRHVIGFLSGPDLLSMRLVSREMRDLVDLVYPDIPEFLVRLEKHCQKDASILFLRKTDKPFCESGWELDLVALFKGDLFEDYERYSTGVGKFGLVYHFDDQDLAFYDGIYSVPIKRTDQGLIFNFHFIYGRYESITFAFWFNNSPDSGIYDDNDGSNYCLELQCLS